MELGPMAHDRVPLNVRAHAARVIDAKRDIQEFCAVCCSINKHNEEVQSVQVFGSTPSLLR